VKFCAVERGEAPEVTGIEKGAIQEVLGDDAELFANV
jgi:hypothetical protein